MANKHKRMSEEEKKKKFGDKYDPKFKPKTEKEDKQGGGGASNSEESHGLKNDWRIYALTEQIAKDFGSFPYNVLSGTRQQLAIVSLADQSAADYLTVVQNVMVLDVVHAQVSTGLSSNGINTAATQLYQYLRHANSGARNYEAADCMMYVLAMRDIYGAFFEIKRLIGLSRAYSLVNRNLPRRLIAALGIDPVDLDSNIAAYRGQLNLLATRINALAMPKYFKAFLRTAFCFSQVFADSDSIRGQFYVYRRAGYYFWSGTTSTSGTQLVFTSYDYSYGTTPTRKLSELLQVLNTMVAAIETDTDCQTIGGDILKAFANSEIYELAQTGDEYVVMPLMDEDALAQIENSFCMTSYGVPLSSILTSATMNVTQTGGYIVWQPKFTLASGVTGYYPKDKYFNSHKDSPDYKDNLEWTRMITLAQVSKSGTAVSVAVAACGLELLLSYHLYLGDDGTPGVEFSNVLNATVSNPVVGLGTLLNMQYDWHPLIYEIVTGTAGTTVVHVLGDLKKYTIITETMVKNIHDAAQTAAFYADGLYARNSDKEG